MQQTLESRRLELCYGKECRELEAICELEKARQLRVQILLLEDDNDNLHAQLAQDDDHIDDLERRNQELQEAFEACESKLESAQGDLRIRSREIETLKVRVDEVKRGNIMVLIAFIGGAKFFARGDDGFNQVVDRKAYSSTRALFTQARTRSFTFASGLTADIACGEALLAETTEHCPGGAGDGETCNSENSSKGR